MQQVGLDAMTGPAAFRRIGWTIELAEAAQGGELRSAVRHCMPLAFSIVGDKLDLEGVDLEGKQHLDPT